jgi:YVTN family beta-propeller protein
MRLLDRFARAGTVRLTGVVVAAAAVAACCVGVSAAAAEGVITTIPVGRYPYAVSSDGAHVWVAIREESAVSEIEASSGTVIRRIPVVADTYGVSSDGTHVWDTSPTADTVTEIDASTGTVIRLIAVGHFPEGVSSDGTHVWTANFGVNTVSEIEASSGTVIRTIPVGNHPTGVSSDGTHVWVTNLFGATVSEIEASSGTIIRTIPVGGYPYGVSSDGTHVWVTNQETVSEIEASSGTVIRTIPVGSRPSGVSSDGTHAWVTSSDDGTVSEIEASSGTVIRKFHVGYQPVAASSDGTDVWVANFGGETVSEFPTSYTVAPPTVVTGSASSIMQTTTTLNATVNPNGEEPSECELEYGTTPSYGSSAPCSPSPGFVESPVAVSASVGSLSEGTTYHFRVVATNTGGTSYGSDQMFTTRSSAPEFGRCVKVRSEIVGTKTVYHGGFTGAACLKASATDTGQYEWEPGVLKAHFTTEIKELTKVKLQTVKGSKVTCTGETSTGEYTGLKTVGGVVLTLTGCELASPKAKCASAGAAAGEIVTKQLEGVLGIDTLGETAAKNRIGLDLFPVGKTGPLMEFSCASTTVSVQGSVIVPVTGNKMLLTVTVKASATLGKQKPENFVGEPKDILEESFNGGRFEQTGLTLTTTQTNEEAVEVNSVV